MMMDQLQDPDLGTLFIRPGTRARRLTFRVKPEGVYVTVPIGTTRREVVQAVESLRPRLLAAQSRQQRPLIDLDYTIDAPLFKLTLTEGRHERFLAHSEPGRMQIVCPPDTRFDDPALQAWLRKVIGEALRRNAQALLPPRLSLLADRHGLAYRSVRINNSRGRWGSCSGRGSINLSYFLILLPQHLVDYVLLHELAHTREMNHGDAFWELLNRLTDGQADRLRKELKEAAARLPF